MVETKTEFRKRVLHFGRVLIIDQESTSLAFLRSLHPKKNNHCDQNDHNHNNKTIALLPMIGIGIVVVVVVVLVR